MLRPLARLLVLLAAATAPIAASAVVRVYDPPDVDRWNYLFNATPGIRPTAPVFGAFATDGQFDQRDGQQLLIFDTFPEIPAGRPESAYTILSASVVLDRNPTSSWVYDATQDGYRTYLALENAADPDALPDTDAGRPLELFGVGYRLAGLDATTYDETGTAFGPSGLVAGTRYAYANDFLAHPTLFGDRDVSNNVLDRFDPTPFGVGTIPGATPGQTVTGAGTVEVAIALTPAVVAYLRDRLAQGSVDLMVTSLEPASFGGPSVYPVLLNKESGTGAATLTLDVNVTPGCKDGVDNDGDGLVDYPADPGCRTQNDDTELFDCQDGVDNDGDGFTDYPADPQCTSPTRGSERPPTCGLLGIEAAGVLAWALVRRRQRRRATQAEPPAR
jgi:hypothetical protein